MSDSIDERVVAMKFDNAQFERGVKQTLASMDALNKGMKMEGATKGLESIGKAADSSKHGLAGIAAGVQNISSKFTALGVIGVTALANIANRAVNAGANLVKSLTLDPIMSGFREYETNLTSIQTILANTGLEGKKGLAQVNKALGELNKYSDQTIYNFSEMARNIGTFTAAGVKLKTATSAIKGIANLAATSGSSAEQASTAMYQLSQAIATGSVKLQDWNSVVNAGMGGKVFQEALKRTARNHGVAVDKIIKKEGSFRESLKTGWLSSKILTETLNQFTGDMTAKQLKQMGYTEKQIKAIQKMGKAAKAAATEIKTFSGFIGALQESVGSGWAQTWQILVGDFGEAKGLFTNLNAVIGGFIQSSSDARNKVLGDWKKLGGRTAIINSIANVFKALVSVIKPIKDAFREIFPATTGKQLADISKSIEKFTQGLVIGAKTSEGLKNTFKGVFAVFDIAKQIIFGVVGGILRLINVFGQGNGSIFTFTGGIGMLVVKFDEWLKKTDVIGKAFDFLVEQLTKVHDKLQPVYDLVGQFADAFAGLTSGGFNAFLQSLQDSGIILDSFADKARGMYDQVAAIFQKLGTTLKGVGNPFESLFGGGEDETGPIVQSINGINIALASAATTGDRVRTAWQQVKDAFKAVGEFLKPVADGIRDAFKAIADKIKTFVSDMGVEEGLAVVNTGFFIAFYMMLRNFIKSLKGIVDSAQGVLDSASGAFNQLTDTLKTMQQDVKANIILKIAAAVAILAISLWLLSKLDLKQIGQGLGAIAIGLVIMVKTMGALSDLAADKSFKDSTNLVIMTAAIAGLGIALLAMAGAVAIFGNMDPATLAKGIGAVAVVLATLVGAVKLLNASGGSAGLVAAAFSILVLSGALLAFAGALKLYSSLDTGMMLEGGAKAAAAIAAIALVMRLMPKNMVSTAKQLIIVAAALVVLGVALKIMASISGGDTAQALILLGGSLLILVTALNAMNGAIVGAQALIIAAGALLILGVALKVLGSLNMKELGIALLALVATFVILGAAGYLLAPVVPVIMGLGIAIALLGAGAALAGAGLFLFAAGLATLAAAGAAGAAAALAAIAVFAEAIPLLMQQFGLGVIAFAKVISESGPPLMEAFATIINAFLEAIIKVLPKVGKLILKLLQIILDVLVKGVPMIVVAAYKMAIGLLTGLQKVVPQLAKKAVDLVLAFLNSLAKQYPRLIDGGMKAIIELINGISDAIDANSAAMGEAGGRLAVSIVKGMADGIRAGVGEVAEAAKGMAMAAVNAVKDKLKIFSPSKVFEQLGKYSVAGFAKGLTGSREQVVAAYGMMKGALSEAYKKSGEDIEKYEEKLARLNKARKKDNKEIAKTEKLLAQARKEHAKEKSALQFLTKNLADEQKKLKSLAYQHDKVLVKLKDAKDALVAAKKVRDDYAKSVKEQYSDIPDITEDETAQSFTDDLKKQLDDVIKYSILLQELRKKGLNDEIYRELLAKGPAAMAFAQDLLENGDIALVNSLESQIISAAGSLGTTASKELYQAGVDAAQGLVDGLIKQEKALQKQMDKLATYMVNAIKKKLGIKSPSKVFEEIGKFTGEGLVDGLDSMSGAVQKSAEGVGKDAILALQKSISDIGTLSGDMDLAPVITPVLDLSEVKKGAGAVGTMLDVLAPLKVDSSYLAAKDASLGYQANQAALEELRATLSQPTTSVEYTQNNYSPKALNEAEVYRQTGNQLSVMKGALPNARQG